MGVANARAKQRLLYCAHVLKRYWPERCGWSVRTCLRSAPLPVCLAVEPCSSLKELHMPALVLGLEAEPGGSRHML